MSLEARHTLTVMPDVHCHRLVTVSAEPTQCHSSLLLPSRSTSLHDTLVPHPSSSQVSHYYLDKVNISFAWHMFDDLGIPATEAERSEPWSMSSATAVREPSRA